MIEGLQHSIVSMLNYNYLAPFFSFIAGILTSFTPCSLTSIPLIVAYVGGSSLMSLSKMPSVNDNKVNTHKALRLSIVFALGSALMFTLLGIVASLAGTLIGTNSSWWNIFLGVLMILMALQIWELYNFLPSTDFIAKKSRRGYIGAFITGALGGVFSSACSTPILIVLLGIVGSDGNVLWGAFLLLSYSIGHSVLVVMAGTSLAFSQKLSQNPKYGKLSFFTKMTLGFLVLLIGFYMLYLGF